MQEYKKNEKGAAIIMTIIITFVILFLVIYFLSFALTEKKIANSQAVAQRTYYLAESGINEIIWLIKNDPNYLSNFESNPSWSTTTTRVAPFGDPSESYSVDVQNTSKAHAIILATAHIDMGGGRLAQRKVRTYIYKAIGVTGVEDNGGYADGNIDISSSVVNFYNGSAHSNNNFIVNHNATINIDSDLDAVGNYNEHWTSNVTIASSTHAANFPPAAAEIQMPAIDFNSTSSDAFINRADVVLTENEFETLMKNNQNLVLNDDITYVKGSVALQGAQTLTIHKGLLVVEEDFSVGFKKNWEGRSGPSSLHINFATGTPAGVIAGRHVDILKYTDTIEVEGVIYANDLMHIKNLDSGSSNFDVIGGLIARKLSIDSCWDGVNITYDADILSTTIGSASSSPTIIVEHWEEEY